MKIDLNQIILADCMDIMRDIPDKYFELAIVDPPYGININMNMGRKKGDPKRHQAKKWDDRAPSTEYFQALFRVSRHQVIWGGNYFKLPIARGWVFWDKCVPVGVSFSDGELAWTSFDRVLRRVVLPYSGFVGCEGKIHPTQKPVALYRWLLQNYANPGDKIIDTHSGSGSCAIACHIEKHDFLAIEKDPDYHAASVKRLEEARAQGVLF